jgi:hypothetical protein
VHGLGESVPLLALRDALQVSWDRLTAHLGASSPDNPSLGQCYPTSWVVQRFFPESEIVQGVVVSAAGEDMHFWNLFPGDVHVDFTWQQFPHGASVREWWVREREGLGDGPATTERCHLLLARVQAALLGTAS